VKVVNQCLRALGLEKHPDRTFIGRIERGFDFLGYHFSPAGLGIAKQAVSAASTLEMYVRRWLRWTRSVEIGGRRDPSTEWVKV
jgi:hypothetical protein